MVKALRIIPLAVALLGLGTLAAVGAPSEGGGARTATKETAELPALPSLPAAGAPTRTASSGDAGRSDPATVVKRGPLREGPSKASRAILQVPEGSQVEVGGMAGPWSKVRVAGGQSGWMPVDSLRIGGQTREASGSWLRKLTGALRPGGSRQPSGGGDAVSVGVRGLTADEVRAARPDIGRVDALERIAVTGPQARARASEAGLASRAVPFDDRAGLALPEQIAHGHAREDAR